MKERTNLIWPITLSALTALNLIICVSGYIFIPGNGLLFLIMCILFMFIGSVISIRFGQSAKYRALVPTLTVALLVSSAFVLEIEFSYGRIMIIAAIVWAFITMYSHIKNKGIIMATMGCLSILVCFILTCTAVFEVLFGDFGLITNEGLTTSPDGTRSAWVQVSDQGALGGSTTVYVRENDKKFVLIGTLKKRKINVRSGRFGENRELEWKNENVLMIDGIEYIL